MRLQGKRVVCFVEEEFEDLELWYPVMRLREEGATVHLVGPEAQTIYTGKYGVPCTTDISMKDIEAEDYDGVLVPGGWAPDKLRRYPEVLTFIQENAGAIWVDQAVVVDGHIIGSRRPPDLPEYAKAFADLLAAH